MAINLAWPRKDVYNATEPFHWYLQYGAILFIGIVFFGGLAWYWFVQRHKTGVLESHRFESASPAVAETPGAARISSLSTRMFIDGEWCDAASGATVEATSPATGESLGPVAEGDREDARRAIAAANAAFPSWAARTGFERAALLHRVADACERRADELARVLTLDQGKPLKAEAEVEVGELIEFFRMAAEDGKRIHGTIPESAAPGRRVLLLRRPLGVLGLITPWNWPYTMPAEVLAPALACGNCVVWTPAPSTAVCSGAARGVRGRGRPAAGRLQPRARPGAGGRRRAGGQPRHARGGVHRLDRRPA